MRVISTDDASARYSRSRLTASWTSRAAIGARMASAKTTSMTSACAPPPLESRERRPPTPPHKLTRRNMSASRAIGADQDRDHQGEPDVEVADVRELVADDPLELLAVELLQEAGGDGDRGVLRVAPGGERIRRRVIDEVDPRCRDAGRHRQLVHHVDQLGRLLVGHLVCLRSAQDESVAREVGRDRDQRHHDHDRGQEEDAGLDGTGPGVADAEAEEAEQAGHDHERAARIVAD